MNQTDPSHEQLPGLPTPQAAAEPSYAPFLLALGITMIFWGIVTSPVMSIGGVVLFGSAMWLWISAIAQGWRK
jgi:hypothetical protein